MSELSPRLRRRIERDFGVDEAVEVSRLVAEASTSERLQAAVVIAARGNVEEIRNGVELASVDFRDMRVNGRLADADWERLLNAELGSEAV